VGRAVDQDLLSQIADPGRQQVEHGAVVVGIGRRERGRRCAAAGCGQLLPQTTRSELAATSARTSGAVSGKSGLRSEVR